jgi:hypothetical protein
MRHARLASIAALALQLQACFSGATQERAPAARVDDFQVLRTYGFDATVSDPQAQWNPETYQLLVRSGGGFALLDEGRGRQQYFSARDKRETSHPVWISRLQFAFGPHQNVMRTDDGRLVPNSEGLTVVTLQETSTGKDYASSSRNLTNSGSRPKVWQQNLVAQFEDRILVIDPFGTINEFGPGFNAEPQRHGPGMVWLDHPVFDPDYWSGGSAKMGKMVIRWKQDVTTVLANAVEASWTRDGGVLATVLHHEPLAGQPWWKVGSDVWFIAGPQAKPMLVAAHVHGPVAHPEQALFAAIDNVSGAVVLFSDDGRDRREIAEHGDHPAWSWDGMRLLVEEAIPAKPDQRYLRVSVLRIGKPLARSAP